jgi:hypothetical protein
MFAIRESYRLMPIDGKRVMVGNRDGSRMTSKIWKKRSIMKR